MPVVSIGNSVSRGCGFTGLCLCRPFVSVSLRFSVHHIHFIGMRLAGINVSLGGINLNQTN